MTEVIEIEGITNQIVFEEPDGSEVVVLSESDESFEILEVAEQGPQGQPGPPGESDKHYLHSQGVASVIWVVNHNLGKYPSVDVLDSANELVEGDVVYNSLNQLTLIFSAPFSGKATCN